MVNRLVEEETSGHAAASGLSERAQLLLKALVESYIRDGQPVGSRTLTRESGLMLSSATVRNTMADLEEWGLVSSPHTSAGRIPTDRGYRFFVDTLLKVKPLDTAAASDFARRLQAGADADDPKSLVATASQLLSAVTQLAGLVTVPRSTYASLTQIEFMSLSENRVLAILVTNGREVQNRVLQLQRRYSSEELRRAANYLNEHCVGRELSEVRAHIIRQLSETRDSMNQMMHDAITLAQKMFEGSAGTPSADVVIAGETNLMGFAELSNVDTLRGLFEAFNEKRDILHLLDQCVGADRVQIFIGQESGYKILDDCTLVSAPYMVDKEVVGVLGVIGPTRMAYERVIPIVDLTARLVGAALNSAR